ncbi:MAG TPA: bifunctional adenosylcobinamide kinase/adenosylcobinamide-phosphate guanylyltransferase [Dehalococcoidia bacterium]|nr:bifunctional adenosylcobinamide kinase/adenosylcobinamide-phosphate guanylyltransferase [Dehalococcoidia bacterium]
MGDLWFVTGGARSGKSRFAEGLARESGRPVVYIATMQPRDDELRRRVERHRNDRPSAWQTIEAPVELSSALASTDGDACALVDCLSLWVANRLMALGDQPDVAAIEALETALLDQAASLVRVASEREGPTVTVTNEVGAGVVPEYALGRAYRDLLGVTNQRVAAHAARAWLMVSGRPLELPPGE